MSSETSFLIVWERALPKNVDNTCHYWIWCSETSFLIVWEVSLPKNVDNTCHYWIWWSETYLLRVFCDNVFMVFSFPDRLRKRYHFNSKVITNFIRSSQIETDSSPTLSRTAPWTVNYTYLRYFHHGSFSITHIYDTFTVAVFLNTYLRYFYHGSFLLHIFTVLLPWQCSWMHQLHKSLYIMRLLN